VRSAIGIARSLRVYHGRPHLGRMAGFYGTLVRPGNLVFDIGAHVGDRTRTFLRLGCRVVAVEPQPRLALLLRVLTSLNRNATIVQAAVSDREATIKLQVNSRNPTVSTASPDFIAAAQAGAAGWAGQAWDREIEVRATTLDALIGIHGVPAFAKIDVEGFEDRVLAGLSVPLPALSFEFTTHQKDVAYRALALLGPLGEYRFNACLGESFTWVFQHPRELAELRAWLRDLPEEANSGDIYCFKRTAGGLTRP
jgi:FkbM family methyltransferase